MNKGIFAPFGGILILVSGILEGAVNTFTIQPCSPNILTIGQVNPLIPLSIVVGLIFILLGVSLLLLKGSKLARLVISLPICLLAILMLFGILYVGSGTQFISCPNTSGQSVQPSLFFWITLVLAFLGVLSTVFGTIQVVLNKNK